MVQSVKIGGIRYSVEVVPDLRDGDVRLSGWIQYDLSKISLDARLGEQMAFQTLWHEILHGIATQSGRQSELKEPMIEALAHGIMQVLKDNPDVGKMIAEKGNSNA